MASAWGSAWGRAWGNSWGNLSTSTYGEDVNSLISTKHQVLSSIVILKYADSNIDLIESSVSVLDVRSVGRFSGFKRQGKDVLSLVAVNDLIYSKIDDDPSDISSRFTGKENSIISGINKNAYVSSLFFDGYGRDVLSTIKNQSGALSNISILKGSSSDIDLLGEALSVLDVDRVGRFSGFRRQGKDILSLIGVNSQFHSKIDDDLNTIFSRIDSKENVINSNIQAVAVVISLIDNLG